MASAIKWTAGDDVVTHCLSVELEDAAAAMTQGDVVLVWGASRRSA